MDVGRAVAWVALGIATVGCASRVELPPRDTRAASAIAGGLEVGALMGAWYGWPADLDRLVTPVRVRVVNSGRAPVRLDASRFALALPGDRRLAAVLPADVRAVEVVPPPAALPRAGLTLGPTRERSGPGWAMSDPQADRPSDPTQTPARTWQLPSDDMVRLALPDGVLAPGQTASGFVYFERLSPDVREVSLTAPVVNAGTGETLGVVMVPLSVR